MFDAELKPMTLALFTGDTRNSKREARLERWLQCLQIALSIMLL
jgi:hypothetical protein